MTLNRLDVTRRTAVRIAQSAALLRDVVPARCPVPSPLILHQLRGLHRLPHNPVSDLSRRYVKRYVMMYTISRICESRCAVKKNILSCGTFAGISRNAIRSRVGEGRKRGRCGTAGPGAGPRVNSGSGQCFWVGNYQQAPLLTVLRNDKNFLDKARDVH
jgi:hypothetical protein